MLSPRFHILAFALLLVFGCAEKQPDESAPMADQMADQMGDTAAAHEMSDDSPARLNLNEASADAFKTIPGMTDRMVREFNEYRPYVSIQQFRREIGKYVSEDVVAGYEQYVYVPVDPNASDAETLKQIPGVDDSVVAEIVAARPFSSADAFVTLLTPRLSDDALEVAKAIVSDF